MSGDDGGGKRVRGGGSFGGGCRICILPADVVTELRRDNRGSGRVFFADVRALDGGGGSGSGDNEGMPGMMQREDAENRSKTISQDTGKTNYDYGDWRGI